MATLDLTAVRPYDVAGIRRRVVGQYSGPAVYVTGGDSLLATELKLGEIETIHLNSATNAAHTTMYHLRWDPVTHLALWWNCATGAEAIAGANLSGYTSWFEAVGK